MYIDHLKAAFGFIQMKFDLLRFVKFCVVGSTGTLINMGLLWGLTEFVGLPYLISAAIAIEISIISNFTFHDFFTFRDRHSPTLTIFFRRLLKYNLISLIGLAINMTVLALFTEVIGLYYLLSNLIGIACATLFRYFLNLRWTWR